MSSPPIHRARLRERSTCIGIPTLLSNARRSALISGGWYRAAVLLNAEGRRRRDDRSDRDDNGAQTADERSLRLARGDRSLLIQPKDVARGITKPRGDLGRMGAGGLDDFAALRLDRGHRRL